MRLGEASEQEEDNHDSRPTPSARHAGMERRRTK